MKAKFLVTGIVLFVCIVGFHSAAGNTQVQGELQKKADKAYVQLDRIGGLPLKPTLGRQHITIG